MEYTVDNLFYTRVFLTKYVRKYIQKSSYSSVITLLYNWVDA